MFKNLLKEKKILVEYVICTVLCAICFFSFMHADIYHTGMSSIAYLEGHIWDFYDFNKEYFGGNNYMPTTYILFAIWNIPLRLFGIVSSEMGMRVPAGAALWFKLFTTVLYVSTGCVFYYIGKELKWSERTSLIAAFLFLSNPIGIYSQFIFSQYDVLTAFFVSLGLLFYIRNDRRKFILFFAIALTCKYFSFLFFLPLLLYKEKNVLKVLANVAEMASLFIVESLFYNHSSAFKNGVFGFGATSYVFENVWDLGNSKVSLVIIAWLVVCGYAYFSEQDRLSDAVFALNLVTFISFGMSFWHPQWLLMAVPVWTLGTLLSKRFDAFIWLDILLYIFYLLFSISKWAEALDENLFKMGILRDIVSAERINLIGQNTNLRDLYVIKDLFIFFSCFAGVLLVYTLFKAPKYQKDVDDVKIDKMPGIVRFRYLFCVLLFVIPAYFCLYKNFYAPNVVRSFAYGDLEVTGMLSDYTTYEERFVADISELTAVAVQTATHDRKNNCLLHVEVIDDESNIIGEGVTGCAGMDNLQFNIIKLDNPVGLEKGRTYSVRLYCSDVKDDFSNAISLYIVKKTEKDNNDYLVVEGKKKKKKDISLKLLGTK